MSDSPEAPATPYDQFRAGERHDDVFFFLHEDAVGAPDALQHVAEDVGTGVVLVLPGDRGGEVFQKVTGLDPMEFAGVAMDTEGHIDASLTAGDCPSRDADSHFVKFVFAFSEEENPEVGGIYAEGDVIHAYAACNCGTTYSDKWVVGERDD
ncbi:DUF5807 family protein [Natronomonas sp. EA1]|uniref:DUF5807 family protein n=1 Tax=Natronomonas sp. EA1 TaxID=3421655 RepID=UPI003EBA1BC7